MGFKLHIFNGLEISTFYICIVGDMILRIGK